MSSIASLLRAVLLGAVLALPLVPSRTSAQTLGGQLVVLGTKKPLGGAAVALVDDSARVVASATASQEGAFYLDAPDTGSFRLVVFVSGGSFVSPSVRLLKGKTVEQMISVPDVPESFATTLFARDVTAPATPVPGGRVPEYPVGLAEEGIRATIATMFVVDENGQPNLSTFRVLSPTPNERFVDAVKAVLQNTRFVPAKKDGEYVPQVVQYTYDFGLAGDPRRGDVVIRPRLAAIVESARREGREPLEPKPPVKTMFVVTADELSKPDVAQLNLFEALNRLRPQVYGGSRSLIQTSPFEGPVYVNEVRVEGIISLRSIVAGDVQQVRFWKREEAAMKFGMEHPYAITVTMRPNRT